ncbi:hypothetical protein OG339_42175 [Streptosporangium sp. NBC_01495]|uniref:hypothetical protein n=1 Tax=Streptosporangium sp. NBC_01495 TaxID=2903899 RepID=UPI002E36770A|nr:hypothetical protein [Streptosporangium sp. NBC_01495]
MTLNITIITENRIFQSSDFRISRGGEVDNDETMKLITLHYPLFDGFVSYTGLATEPLGGDGRDIADRVTEWLQGKRDIHFYEAVEVIRSRASSYMSSYEKRWGELHRLTLIAAAFVRSKPVVAIISNSRSAEGKKIASILPNLETNWISLKRGRASEVIITGDVLAVSPESHADLEELVREAGADSARIRVGIQDVNRMAAQSGQVEGKISKNCTVVSLDESGSGLQNLTEPLTIDIRSVNNGISWNVAEVLQSIGISGAILAGASFGTSKPRVRRLVECDRRLIDMNDSRYQLTEIEHMVNAECRACGINSSGAVVGATGSLDDPTFYRYWRWGAENEMRRLDYWTRNYNAAINDKGDMALRVMIADGSEVIVVLTDSFERYLEIPEGMAEAEITSINSYGSVVGSISINLDVTDGNRQRPAFWDSSGKLHVLDRLGGGENGRAVDINDAGLILVWANQGFWGRVTLVWDINSNDVQVIPGSVMPVSMTSTGSVVGIGRASNNQQVPVISYDRQSWNSVPVNSGFSPSTANDSLHIAGQVPMDGYFTPWLLLHNKSAPLLLPTYEHHNGHPHAMNKSGIIVGQASTDNDYHVLLWQPPLELTL